MSYKEYAPVSGQADTARDHSFADAMNSQTVSCEDDRKQQNFSGNENWGASNDGP